ncbi:MAG TPA: outer membrane lipoprotein carrier protein LolA [Candidatus Angelobacter sp.]
MKLRLWAIFFCLTMAILARGQATAFSAAVSEPRPGQNVAKSAGQTAPAAGEKKPGPAPIAPAGPNDLKALLAQMNNSAKTFQTAQADFQWDSFQMVVKETDVQKGQMFLRRTSKGMDAALRVTSPDLKHVVFKDCILSFYQIKIDQVTKRNACENRADVESFMSLGFGASGDDLTKKYAVTMEGWETVQGVKTAKLYLVPREDKLKGSLSKIILWVDPSRSLAIQQQFLEPSGDYRLAKYSNIKVNGKVPDDAFKLKTTSKTTFVGP